MIPPNTLWVSVYKIGSCLSRQLEHSLICATPGRMANDLLCSSTHAGPYPDITGPLAMPIAVILIVYPSGYPYTEEEGLVR